MARIPRRIAAELTAEERAALCRFGLGRGVADDTALATLVQLRLIDVSDTAPQPQITAFGKDVLGEVILAQSSQQ